MTESETEQPITEDEATEVEAQGRLVAGGGATVPAGPTDAERQRLLEQRAMLVERRRVIMFGSARDAYGKEIARIDRLLAARRLAAGQ